MKPADMERELNEDPVSSSDKAADRAAAKAERAAKGEQPDGDTGADLVKAVPMALVLPKAPTIFEEAVVLRSLLFAVAAPQRAAVAVASPGRPMPPPAHHSSNGHGTALASHGHPATNPPRQSRRRRRR